jgi:hypothetical protein
MLSCAGQEREARRRRCEILNPGAGSDCPHADAPRCGAAAVVVVWHGVLRGVGRRVGLGQSLRGRHPTRVLSPTRSYPQREERSGPAFGCLGCPARCGEDTVPGSSVCPSLPQHTARALTP